VIRRVHHVGIAVRSLAAAQGFWRDALGLVPTKQAEIPDQGVRAVLLACGSAEIELIEPAAPDTGLGRFLARRGEGLHHLCFESDDVGRDVKRFWATGVDMLDGQPRKGLAGLVAFLHPRACAGVLVELATPTEKEPATRTPCSLAAVHLTVTDVRAASQIYRDLFGLALVFADPAWRFAQLAVAGVSLQFASDATTAFAPGLSALRLAAPDPVRVAEALDAGGVARRQWSAGFVIDPGATSGVPLIVHGPGFGAVGG
jgi:methylmalonyl-CoA/ethylmalonyl-CoA epimerase